jgi:hypothetical protein
MVKHALQRPTHDAASVGVSRSPVAIIQNEWIQRTVQSPVREMIQADGRIRRWSAVPEAGGKFLRVILLPDGETVHNAFFDRGFKP